MSTILVTGGGGFIGRAVVDELIRKGHKVIVFDLARVEVPNLAGNYTGSILDPYALLGVTRGCDYVFHLAASLGVRHTETNRMECLYININGTVNVLEACIKNKVKKIVFASSSEVYGEQNRHPITEEAPLNPRSNYAISKIVGEEYLRAYRGMHGIDYSIVRFFNVYGEYQREDFVLPCFIKSVQSGIPPRIYGDGRQVRCFCHAEDAARGMVEACFSGQPSSVYNIGNDKEPVSIKELADRIISISGMSFKSEFVPYTESDRNEARDIMKRIPSIDKARRELGYETRVSLNEGLRRVYNHHASQKRTVMAAALHQEPYGT